MFILCYNGKLKVLFLLQCYMFRILISLSDSLISLKRQREEEGGAGRYQESKQLIMECE